MLIIKKFEIQKKKKTMTEYPHTILMMMEMNSVLESNEIVRGHGKQIT